MEQEGDGMSILIKGMEMPKTCNDCGLRDSFDCWITDSYIEARFSKRNEDCPLVEIPTPHGRLIDADKLNIHDVSPAYGFCVMGVTEEDIELAETVIEAEGSEE